MLGLVCYLRCRLPTKMTKLEEGPVRQLTNQAYMSGFRQYAMAFKLKLQEYGNGPVRILAAGNVGFGPEEAVQNT